MIPLFLLFISVLRHAPDDNGVTGKVVAVIDGDVLEVLTAEHENYRIVLQGIDCPELGQPYGREAAALLKKHTLGREVFVTLRGKDRSKSYIAVVLLPDGTDVRRELLQKGLAWTSEKDPVPELEALRQEAQVKKKGLWREKDPTPPWIYRREETMLRPKSR